MLPNSQESQVGCQREVLPNINIHIFVSVTLKTDKILTHFPWLLTPIFLTLYIYYCCLLLQIQSTIPREKH